MLARKLRFVVVPNMGLNVKKFISSNIAITPVAHDDTIMKFAMGAAGTGGLIGCIYGSYNGYLENRHRSYEECAVGTTASCFIGTATGIFGGVMSFYVGPFLLPFICLGVPVASGAVVAKYLEENANKKSP